MTFGTYFGFKLLDLANTSSTLHFKHCWQVDKKQKKLNVDKKQNPKFQYLFQYLLSHIHQHAINLLYGISTHFCGSSLNSLITWGIQQSSPSVWATDRTSPGSPPAQGWTAAGGLWRSAPAHWLDRWRRSTAGSSWMPPSSQHRSPQRWGCTGPFSLFSRNGTSCLPLHSWRSGGRDVIRWAGCLEELQTNGVPSSIVVNGFHYSTDIKVVVTCQETQQSTSKRQRGRNS